MPSGLAAGRSLTRGRDADSSPVLGSVVITVTQRHGMAIIGVRFPADPLDSSTNMGQHVPRLATLPCKESVEGSIPFCSTMICTWHLCTNQLSGQQRKFCSTACKSKYYVTKNRQDTKKKLVELFGGKCVRCGYSKCVNAFHFHHKDDNKEFGIAQGGSSRAWSKVLEEAQKCEMVCSNCHAELHSGMA